MERRGNERFDRFLKRRGPNLVHSLKKYFIFLSRSIGTISSTMMFFDMASSCYSRTLQRSVKTLIMFTVFKHLNKEDYIVRKST